MAWKSTSEAPPAVWEWTRPEAATPKEEQAAIEEIHRQVKAIDGEGLTGKSMLDLGCGRGACLRSAMKFSPGRLVGVDSAQGALRATATVVPQAFRIKADARSVPLKRGIVALVWSHGVVEHFTADELPAYFREAGRLASGWVAFSAPNPNCGPYAECKAMMLGDETWAWGYEEPMASYRDYVEAIGFQVVADVTVGNTWEHVHTYASRLDSERTEYWQQTYGAGVGPGVYTLVIGRRK
jgi:trans-aconitate methyltransferase